MLNISFIDGVFSSVKLRSPKSGKHDGDEGGVDIVLPENIDTHSLKRLEATDGSLGRAMLMNSISSGASEADPKRLPTVLVRFAVLAFGVWFWQSGSEVLLSLSGPITVLDKLTLFDVGHKLTEPLFELLTSYYPSAFEKLYNIQLLSTNIIVILMMFLSVFGTTTRPAVTGILTLLARAFLQFCTPFLALSTQVFVPPVYSEHFSLFNTTSSASILSPHIIVACVFFF